MAEQRAPGGQLKPLVALHHGPPENKAQGSVPLPAQPRGPQGTASLTTSGHTQAQQLHAVGDDLGGPQSRGPAPKCFLTRAPGPHTACPKV